MKKYCSVWMLMARSSLYKILAALLLMAALQAGLFILAIKGLLPGGIPLHIEDVFRVGCTPWVFAAAFLAITFFLCRTGCETGAKTGYTLQRLRISQKAVFFLQGSYNALCYLILWTAELLIVLALSRFYILQAGAETLGSQTQFLAFYRSSFLHALLPFEEITVYLRNLLFILMLSFAAARCPIAQRNGGKVGEIIPACVAAIALFPHSIANSANDFLSFLIASVILAVTLYQTPKKHTEVTDFYDE